MTAERITNATGPHWSPARLRPHLTPRHPRGMIRAMASTITDATADKGPAAPNLLYYGDNLDILRRHIEDESIDRIYLDPPFNTNV